MDIGGQLVVSAIGLKLESWHSIMKNKTWIICPDQNWSYLLTAVNLKVCLVINIFSPKIKLWLCLMPFSTSLFYNSILLNSVKIYSKSFNFFKSYCGANRIHKMQGYLWPSDGYLDCCYQHPSLTRLKFVQQLHAGTVLHVTL